MKIMTPEQFIESAPLYTRFETVDFASPKSITRACSSKTCKRETTWSISGTANTPPNLVSVGAFKTVVYTCMLCRTNNLTVMFELLNWSQAGESKVWSYRAVRKIGQVPPHDISIPAELEDRLGETAGHYKKALVSRNSCYGIGAMAYLRRVVDEQTDALIDVMLDLSRTYGVEDEILTQLEAAKNEVRYEEKLRTASELLPTALRPGGVNPLGQLYKHTSTGLHGKTDDECVAIFDDLKADFEYVFRNLHQQAEERREFARRVQERAGRN
jgi:hypothetical protein